MGVKINNMNASNKIIQLQRLFAYGALLLGCILFLASSFSGPSVMSYADVFIGLISISQVYLIVFEYKLMRKISKLPNVILGLPYFGQFWMLMPGTGRSFIQNIFSWKDQVLEKNDDSGEPFGFHILGRPVMIFTREEDVAFLNGIERKGNTKVSLPKAIKPLFGEASILLLEGKHHRVLRRVMEPIFSPTSLEAYTKVLDDLIVKHLEEWSLSKTWHSTTKFKMLTLRLLLCIIFEDINEELIFEFYDSLSIWLAGFSALVIRFPGTKFYKASQAKAKMESMIGELIANFKIKYPDGDSQPEVKTLFLGRLIYGTDENGQRLSDAEIKTNIIFILFAGHDTTYASMGSFLHYLTKLRPNVYDALVEEVQGVKEPFDNQDLRNNAPILNAFLAEVWRVKPPVTGSSRNMMVKEIEYKGYTYPKDSAIIVSAYLSHKEYYGKTASDFYIERWLPDNHSLVLAASTTFDTTMMKDYNQISRAFKTFGIGTHACLGHYFAKFEARIIMIRMLQRYDIEIRNSKLIDRPIVTWSSEFQLSQKK